MKGKLSFWLTLLCSSSTRLVTIIMVTIGLSDPVSEKTKVDEILMALLATAALTDFIPYAILHRTVHGWKSSKSSKVLILAALGGSSFHIGAAVAFHMSTRAVEPSAYRTIATGNKGVSIALMICSVILALIHVPSLLVRRVLSVGRLSLPPKYEPFHRSPTSPLEHVGTIDGGLLAQLFEDQQGDDSRHRHPENQTANFADRVQTTEAENITTEEQRHLRGDRQIARLDGRLIYWTSQQYRVSRDRIWIVPLYILLMNNLASSLNLVTRSSARWFLLSLSFAIGAILLLKRRINVERNLWRKLTVGHIITSLVWVSCLSQYFFVNTTAVFFIVIADLPIFALFVFIIVMEALKTHLHPKGVEFVLKAGEWVAMSFFKVLFGAKRLWETCRAKLSNGSNRNINIIHL